MMRKFDTVDSSAAMGGNRNLPLMVALMGYAHSGKTYSALALATGFQRVVGGDIWVIGTEGDTALQYADTFAFRHVRLDPPYSGDDYLAAVEHCVAQGARNIVIDNLSYEHTGEGGLLDAKDAIVSRMIESARKKPWNRDKTDEQIEDAIGQIAWAQAKEPRKRLERALERHRNAGVIFTLTYRAGEKYVPKKRGDKDAPDHQWKIEGTSQLPYVATLRWLLRNGGDGRAVYVARTDEERAVCKTPDPYRPFCKDGVQLSADMGEAIARYARGSREQSSAAKASQAKSAGDGRLEFSARYEHASGAVEDADPPDLDAYLIWLDSQPASAKRDEHRTRVQAIYARMIAQEIGE